MQELSKIQFDELVALLRRICSFDSKLDTAEVGAPFGKGVAACLEDLLAVAKDYGFKAENVDGYAGEISFVGTGEQSVGILGHIDIIPADPVDWKHHPFKGEIENGFLFARGAMDDKGPLLACLYAMKLLKDEGFTPTRTIKIIAGCDEETAMRGAKYYLKHRPAPEMSFTPDADFPVIHAEKGIMHFDVDCGTCPEIKSVSCGVRANVVCDKADAVVVKDGKEITLSTKGVAAHASLPQTGKNASWELLAKLHALFPENKAFAFLSEKVCDWTGKKWGIARADDISTLTCNLGILKIENGKLIATIDIRFPVSMTLDEMTLVVKQHTPYEIEVHHSDNPLYVDENSFLVQTLLSVYNGATGENAKPLVIGGGTYSKIMPNCVAFGPSFPGEEETIHMPDERINLENLKKMTLIYKEAIKKLSK